MFTNLKRAFKFALSDFSRNIGRSISAIFVLMIIIIFVTGLFFLRGASNFIISEVQNKIDITAYFKSDAKEEDILNIKDTILKDFPDIKKIQYVSKEDALNNFTLKHQGNSVFSNALTQVGDNPFLSSLNITTTGNALQYENVANVLQSDQYSNLIEKVDFSDKKATIEKIFSITSSINTFGLVLAIILILIAILVVFNTIKLAIDSSKDELTTMRIVGASSWFIRTPFIIQGALFGFVSFVFCFFITAFMAYFLSSGLLSIMAGFSLWHYFISNIFLIILIQLLFGVALGIISSFIVVQKYLKI